MKRAMSTLGVALLLTGSVMWLFGLNVGLLGTAMAVGMQLSSRSVVNRPLATRRCAVGRFPLVSATPETCTARLALRSWFVVKSLLLALTSSVVQR